MGIGAQCELKGTIEAVIGILPSIGMKVLGESRQDRQEMRAIRGVQLADRTAEEEASLSYLWITAAERGEVDT